MTVMGMAESRNPATIPSFYRIITRVATIKWELDPKLCLQALSVCPPETDPILPDYQNAWWYDIPMPGPGFGSINHVMGAFFQDCPQLPEIVRNPQDGEIMQKDDLETAVTNAIAVRDQLREKMTALATRLGHIRAELLGLGVEKPGLRNPAAARTEGELRAKQAMRL